MTAAEQIRAGKTCIGIELGSTRIKAVLIGEEHTPLAQGVHDWQNTLADGVWTYPLTEVQEGLQDCFRSLMQNVEAQYGEKLTTTAGFGISAMMHGYLVFDEAG
ncbi:MAG: ATPase, partial [Oscillospiraceae bacterium]|nr:ATPase [Oscillospiraceae bacterium]